MQSDLLAERKSLDDETDALKAELASLRCVAVGQPGVGPVLDGMDRTHYRGAHGLEGMVPTVSGQPPPERAARVQREPAVAHAQFLARAHHADDFQAGQEIVRKGVGDHGSQSGQGAGGQSGASRRPAVGRPS
jgi:hypothetical protein